LSDQEETMSELLASESTQGTTLMNGWQLYAALTGW
jgi:hypothetical protein